MKVAAYQAPLLTAGSMDGLALIRDRVRQCEAEDVAILCCPEAILGGLADYADDPSKFAIAADNLESVLSPLASDTVTTVTGFTELADGRLFNSAAVFHRGAVAGIYRKLHPFINHSVYQAGRDVPVFHVGGLTFGIVICNDSNFAEPATLMAAQGAKALFVPTNCGLPAARFGAEIVDQARKADIALAVNNGMWVIRADVSGRAGDLVSYGSSGIVHPTGIVVQSARQMSEDFVVANISHLSLTA